MRITIYPLICLTFLIVAPNHPAAAPNIVVIQTDDQDDIGSMQRKFLPKLNALLADQGVTFKNSFANFPLCGPSRASLLTGQTALNHGMLSNKAPDGGWSLFMTKEDNTLPVWLQAAGYKTALVGKYINQYGWRPALPTWIPHGWDFWFSPIGNGEYFDYDVNDNGAVVHKDRHDADYSTDVLAQRAVQVIKAPRTKPLFLLIATEAPHHDDKLKPEFPIAAPRHRGAFLDEKAPTTPSSSDEKVIDKPAFVKEASERTTSKKDYIDALWRTKLQSMLAVDDLIEAVVNALRETNQLDNTFIVFTSDNGFTYGQHGLLAKSGAYEDVLKVPLVIRGPGVPAGETRTQMVSNLDVTAFIVDLAGATPRLPLDGRSLAPLLKDQSSPWRSAMAFTSRTGKKGQDSEGFLGGELIGAVRTVDRKYIVQADGFEELYDLGSDPNELKNKAADPAYAEDLTKLRALYAKLKTCSGILCWVP